MRSAIECFAVAARSAATLPDGWEPYRYEVVHGQGTLVTGKVVTGIISRGPRKGEPNFRTADPATKRTVFVSNEAFDLAKDGV